MSSETKQEVVVASKPRSELAEVAHPSHMFGALEEVERLFDRLLPRGWMSPMSWNWPMWPGAEESPMLFRTPRLNIVDRDQDLLIHVEMPGVEKRGVEVSVTNNTLNIRGTLQQQSSEQRKDYYRCEIAQGSFARSLFIPAGVDKTRISASLKDGILEIQLPKEAEAQRRSVEIK